MGLLTSITQGPGEEEVGVSGSWEIPAKCTLNLKLAGRAEGAEEAAGRRENMAGKGKSKGGGGCSLVIRTLELQKS